MFLFVKYLASVLIFISVVSFLLKGAEYNFEEFYPLDLWLPCSVFVVLCVRIEVFRDILIALSIFGIAYFIKAEGEVIAAWSPFYFTQYIISYFDLNSNQYWTVILLTINALIYPMLLISAFTKGAKKFYGEDIENENLNEIDILDN